MRSRRSSMRRAASASLQVLALRFDVNMLKMHRQMADMMKKMSKGGMKGMMNALGGAGVSPKDIAKMGQGAGMPADFPVSAAASCHPAWAGARRSDDPARRSRTPARQYRQYGCDPVPHAGRAIC